MSTPNFPSLEATPAVKEFGHGPVIDPVHRVKFENGTPLTRVLFTNIPVKYSVFYEAMKEADKEDLEDWEKNTIGYGGTQFNWTNPNNSTTYLSVLTSPIRYNAHPQSSGNVWQAKFNVVTLSEVEE